MTRVSSVCGNRPRRISDLSHCSVIAISVFWLALLLEQRSNVHVARFLPPTNVIVPNRLFNRVVKESYVVSRRDAASTQSLATRGLNYRQSWASICSVVFQCLGPFLARSGVVVGEVTTARRSGLSEEWNCEERLRKTAKSLNGV